MNKKTKILFITEHFVHDSTYQAGHKSFSFYLDKFSNDELFEVAYVVDHNNDFINAGKMKNQFPNAHDFSIKTPAILKKLKYPFYKKTIKNLLSIIKPSWLYLEPFRGLVYKKALKSVLDQGWVPDIIAFEWTEMLFLSDYCKQLFPKAIFIATEHDVSFNKVERMFDKSILQKKFLVKQFKALELAALQLMDLILVLSSNDFSLLINNGIDAEKVLLISPFYNRSNRSQALHKNEVIYYGAMNREENMHAVKWFIENVFIPFNLSDLVKFVVIGAGTSASFSKKYKDVPGVVFTGFVEDPAKYFETALCMVVPLTFGGGIKIKILEAMSGAVTVLSNNVGIEGISAESGINYMHCTDPIDYGTTIKKLFSDRGLAYKIGGAGRVMMESNYNFVKSYETYKTKIIDLSNQNARKHFELNELFN